MKATKIYYKRLFNLGQYQNKEIGIEIQLEEGDKAKEVLSRAKTFVERQDPDFPLKKRIDKLEEVINKPTVYTYEEVLKAQEELPKLLDELNEDLPF